MSGCLEKSNYRFPHDKDDEKQKSKTIKRNKS